MIKKYIIMILVFLIGVLTYYSFTIGYNLGGITNSALKINEKEDLFNINLEILDDHKEILRGDNLVVIITLENFGLREELIDVNVRLSIMDLERKIVYVSSDEFIAMGRRLSIVREINVPGFLNQGDYLVLAEMKYNNNILESSDTFSVVELKNEESKVEQPKYYENSIGSVNIVLTVIIILLLVYIIFSSYLRRSK